MVASHSLNLRFCAKRWVVLTVLQVEAIRAQNTWVVHFAIFIFQKAANNYDIVKSQRYCTISPLYFNQLQKLPSFEYYGCAHPLSLVSLHSSHCSAQSHPKGVNSDVLVGHNNVKRPPFFYIWFSNWMSRGKGEDIDSKLEYEEMKYIAKFLVVCLVESVDLRTTSQKHALTSAFQLCDQSIWVKAKLSV